MRSMILQVISAALVPLTLVFSIYLLFRGHNAPGGGFIAGLVTSLSIILIFLAYGMEFFNKISFLKFNRLFALGLAFAVLTGLGAIIGGKPFLTSKSHWHLPLLGDAEIPSAMFFDLGVYFVVVGVVLDIIHTLAEERKWGMEDKK